jgi:ParB-like chromosome segregation protein Spo0J
MNNKIQSIAVDKFVPHPDNPNRMSKANFAKLVRNIKRTGRYEPLVVRPCAFSSGRNDHCQSVAAVATAKHSHDNKAVVDHFQIINGHHRWQALKELGYKHVDAVVWDIDDQQTDILLATLNRLGGSDILEKKFALLKRLNKRMEPKALAKFLPQTAKQIERLTNLKTLCAPITARANCFANALVFFVDDQQQKVIEEAVSLAGQNQKDEKSAVRKAAALVEIAENYLAERK